MCGICVETEAVVQEALDAHPLVPWPNTHDSWEFFDYVNEHDLPPFHLYCNTSHPYASDRSRCPHLFEDRDWERELFEHTTRIESEVEDLWYGCEECQRLALEVIEKYELSEGAKRRAEQERIASLCRCDGCEQARLALPEGLERGPGELAEIRRTGAPYFHVIHEYTGWTLGMSELTKTECAHTWDDELWSSMVEDGLRELINCVDCEKGYEAGARLLSSQESGQTDGYPKL